MGFNNESLDNGLVLSRRTLVAGLGAGAFFSSLSLGGCARSALIKGAQPLQSAIYPGEIWRDTEGKPIQAHAGSLIAVGDTYYWYGENKEYTDGESGIESWGIRFYKSKDMYNWEDLGALVPPNIENPESPLSYKIFPERPHILQHPVTGKFICWLKIRGLGPQFRTVLVADEITGPYTMVHNELRPGDMEHSGDFDLVVDESTNKAYMYYEHDHREIVCIELTEDWMDTTDVYTRHLARKAPHSREAPALFKRDGKLYMATSGLTGYFPNPTEIAVSDDFHGPFNTLGLFHPRDQSETSFASQISDIFKVPGKKNLYIALADRWLPHIMEEPTFADGTLSSRVRSAIEKATAKPRRPMTEEERHAIRYAAHLKGVNTSKSRYVWLPIDFSGDYPVIHWRDSWRVEDFD